MFERNSKQNQASEIISSSYSDAKMITLENLNHKQNNELSYNKSIVKFCKDSIEQLNDTNKKG